MRPFIVIRQFESADRLSRKDLIKQYSMSFALDAFLSCLFREVFIQLVVLVAAIMFILLGFPLTLCLMSLPIVVLIIYISVYSAYFAKALELSNDPITTCWVAEVYEPYLVSLNMTSNAIDYDIVSESRLHVTDFEVNRMKRTIVATISIDDHRTMPGAGWLNHFAIQSNKVNVDKVAEALIHRALKHAIDIKFDSVEITTTECQCELRETLLKIGFDIRQVYHQYILANNNFRIMKSQMGINVTTWKNSKDK